MTTTFHVVRESVEQRLRRLLAELLEMDAESVDPDVPLTAFGVCSRTAVSILADMEKWTGVELPIEVFLEGPSITQMAHEISLVVRNQPIRR